jgi:hypothetical protein
MSFSARNRPCSLSDGNDTLMASGPRASAIRQTQTRLGREAKSPVAVYFRASTGQVNLTCREALVYLLHARPCVPPFCRLSHWAERISAKGEIMLNIRALTYGQLQ